MAYDWARRAKLKALNEKRVSKKTQDALFHAYKTLREINDGRSKALDKPGEERIQEDGGVDQVQNVSSEGEEGKV